jgi:hypothetical protein
MADLLYGKFTDKLPTNTNAKTVSDGRSPVFYLYPVLALHTRVSLRTRIPSPEETKTAGSRHGTQSSRRYRHTLRLCTRMTQDCLRQRSANQRSLQRREAAASPRRFPLRGNPHPSPRSPCCRQKLDKEVEAVYAEEEAEASGKAETETEAEGKAAIRWACMAVLLRGDGASR